MRAKHLRALLLCLPLLWAAGAQAQTVKAGIEAWQRADYERAVAIWRPLAEGGDTDAAFNLGQAYRLGRGVKTDLATAQIWLDRAASQGHTDAQTTLGLLLFGNGDHPGGLKWLGKAAEKGDPRAMLIYGTALFNGDGLPQDQVLGYAFVSRAAAQGLAPAKATLKDMDEIMPLAQRKKGLALAMQKAKTQKSASKPAKVVQASKAVPSKPAPSREAPRTIATVSGGWYLQLGAFSQRASADALFRKLSSAAPVAGKEKRLVAAGAVTRLQVGPYESRSAAAAACASLAKRGQACFPVAG